VQIGNPKLRMEISAVVVAGMPPNAHARPASVFVPFAKARGPRTLICPLDHSFEEEKTTLGSRRE